MASNKDDSGTSSNKNNDSSSEKIQPGGGSFRFTPEMAADFHAATAATAARAEWDNRPPETSAMSGSFFITPEAFANFEAERAASEARAAFFNNNGHPDPEPTSMYSLWSTAPSGVSEVVGHFSGDAEELLTNNQAAGGVGEDMESEVDLRAAVGEVAASLKGELPLGEMTLGGPPSKQAKDDPKP